jgi:two-component system chemotaxis response regulator CheY
MLLVDMLQRFERVEIIEAADAESAWKEIEGGLCPVLACCDIRMPGMSGIELLQRFKSRPVLADVPFIFFSAATDRGTITEAIAAGATDYILKPFDLRAARSSLEKAFRGIRARYCEDPSATRKRLDLPPEKLLAYLDAFKQQLADCSPRMQEQSAGADPSAAGARLDNLQANGTTLGLWQASTTIQYARSLRADLVARIVTDVATIVDEQVLRAKAEFGIREPRSPKADEKAAQGNQ